MTSFRETVLCTIVAAAVVSAAVFAQPATPSSAKQGFEKLKALDGEWVDARLVATRLSRPFRRAHALLRGRH